MCHLNLRLTLTQTWPVFTKSKTRYCPRLARRYAPYQGQWQKPRQIYVRPQTGSLSACLRWPAVAKLQAASVPIALAAVPWDRDRQADGQIAVLLNAPLLNGSVAEWLARWIQAQKGPGSNRSCDAVR